MLVFPMEVHHTGRLIVEGEVQRNHVICRFIFAANRRRAVERRRFDSQRVNIHFSYLQ